MSYVIYLVLAAGQDFRRKRISGWMCLFFFAHFLVARVILVWFQVQQWEFPASLWFQGFGTQKGVLPLFAGCCIGLFLLVVSLVTEGQIGLGDGIFYLISGLYLGFWRTLFLFVTSLFLGCLAGSWKLIAGKLQGRNVRRETLPFLVFALPAGLWMILGSV